MLINFSQYKKAPMVHHYTTQLYHLAKIFAAGELRPSAAGCEPHELPMLWFSRDQRWEPTATKGDLGESPKLAFAKHLEHCGCARFSLPADDPRLMNWQDACKFAGIRREMRRALEVSGLRMGAEPANWLAIASSVRLADVRLQRFDGAKWVDMAASEISPYGLTDYLVHLSVEGRPVLDFVIMAKDHDEAMRGARTQASELAIHLGKTVAMEISPV